MASHVFMALPRRPRASPIWRPTEHRLAAALQADVRGRAAALTPEDLRSLSAPVWGASPRLYGSLFGPR